MRLFTWIRDQFRHSPATLGMNFNPPTAPAVPPQAPPAWKGARAVTPADPATARPSPAPVQFNSAVELLENQPHLSAAELAQRLGVTVSYARRLIRQRKMKQPAVPPRAMKAEPKAEAPVATPTRKWTRLPLEAPVQPMLLTPRAQVLERSADGYALQTIADDLRLPQDEVDFIVKIGRLKNSLKN